MLQLFFSSASKEIFTFPTIMYIQLILILIILILLLTTGYILSVKYGYKIKKKALYAVCTVFLLLTVLYHSIHAYAHHKNNLSIMQVAYILPQSYPLILNKVLESYGITSANEQVAHLNIKKMNYPHKFPEYNDNKSRYNIVFIVIESWRFDCMNSEVTPNINKFAKNNIIFTNHNANSNQTRHGLFSIFYSLPGSYWNSALFSGTTPVILDILQHESYQLGIFASSSLTSPEFNRTIFAKVPNLRLNTNAPTPNLRDEKITEEFSLFLDNISENSNFFGFLFYDSPHSYSFNEKIYPAKFKPYSKHKNYINIGNKDILFNLYKNTLGYTDILVGRVLKKLEEKNLLENTIVIITGDHAEEFDDLNKNYYGHLGNYSKYQTQVPFIIHIPNKEHNIYEYETSHLDIVPTILKNVFHSTTSIKEYSTGYDLFDNTTRPFIYIKGEEFAIKYNNKYIIIKKYGLPEVRDMEYNIIDEKIDSAVIKQMLQQLSYFQ